MLSVTRPISTIWLTLVGGPKFDRFWGGLIGKRRDGGSSPNICCVVEDQPANTVTGLGLVIIRGFPGQRICSGGQRKSHLCGLKGDSVPRKIYLPSRSWPDIQGGDPSRDVAKVGPVGHQGSLIKVGNCRAVGGYFHDEFSHAHGWIICQFRSDSGSQDLKYIRLSNKRHKALNAHTTLYLPLQTHSLLPRSDWNNLAIRRKSKGHSWMLWCLSIRSTISNITKPRHHRRTLPAETLTFRSK